MSNERTRRVVGERDWARVLGRALLSTLIAGAALGATSTRAEAQTVIVENGRAASMPHTIGDMTIVEPGEPMGPGAGPSLAAGGAFLLTAGWVSSFAVGLHEGPALFLSDEQINGERRWHQDFRFTSFLPVVGPWIALTEQKQTEFDDDFWGVWLVANGLLQAAGLSMMIGGIIASAAHGTRMSNRIASRTSRTEDRSFTLVPTLSPQQLGLSAAGTF